MRFFSLLTVGVSALVPLVLFAQSQSATTTLSLSICGNSLVDGSEECDVPGETGVYSQTIAGRQCTADCQFGPYCGDGILQTQFGEECDDGNNDDGDFCSAICLIEPAGSGGGGSSGGGSGGSGGSNRELNDTQVRLVGIGYPRRTVNVLIDGETVGTIRADTNGAFEFVTEVEPGTASLGVWSTDGNGVRSITFNSTFDVTQGAVTSVNSVVLPPTISLSSQSVDPGDPVTLFGQSAPEATVEIHLNDSDPVFATASDEGGEWEYTLNTETLSPAEYTIKARSITGTPPLTTESAFSSSIQLFLGVDGQPVGPADLNRDGFVNLTDFSILVFWWETTGGDSDPPADINGNGNVGLEDFSILLFNWTG